MKPGRPKAPTPEILHQQAEEALARRPAPSPMGLPETTRLVHELQVHQIELEMQNEALTELQAETQARAEDLARLNTELKQVQAQLLQSEKMAVIGQLAAGVAHEINNPIGFIQSNLGTLEEYVQDMLEVLDYSRQCADSCTLPGRLDALQKKRDEKDIDFIRTDIMQLLAESKDGTDRVSRIVQNLKDFSHVSEEAWSMSDLHAGLDSTLNLAWNEIKYKAEVEKCYGQLPRVYCLPAQLNLVFMNLLVNAAQAIETRGKITIATGVMPGESQVWIEIRDTGKGMTPEVMKHIFEPFFTTKPVGKGTGLGLSLAWNTIEKHHGRIDVESQVGEGTTFRITLPIQSEAGTVVLAS